MINANTIYDVIILGGGTGGYVAAIRAAQLGLKVVMIEEDKVGGTCLHRGCIPSKAYLRTAEMLQMIKQSSQFGIEIAEPQLSWAKVMERKNTLVQSLHQGVKGLIKKNKIELIYGQGFLSSIDLVAKENYFTVCVHECSIYGKQVILATGSRPAQLGLQLDSEHIMTSDQALARVVLPKSVIIIGGGTIGMEWASLYNDCGVDVTVVETQHRILMTEDEEIAKEAFRLFLKRGIQFHLGATVIINDIHKMKNGVNVPILQKDGTKIDLLEAEALLLSVGRLPNI